MCKVKPVVYLAGPINGCTDSECKDWREEAKTYLVSRGIVALDPMRRDYRGIEEGNLAAIVEDDKKDIEVSDTVLAYCPKPSYGTAMEIFFAKGLGKRVVVVSDSRSPWILYHADVVVQTIGDALPLLIK